MKNTIDTIKVEIVSKYLDKISSTLGKPNEGLSSGEIALIAAAIGASAAILSQLIIFILNHYKDKRNLKKELIAEERRISYLLTELYKELVMNKVHKQYWFRTSEILNYGTDDGKDSHNRHFKSNERSFETLTKIRILASDYFKVVTQFQNITSKSTVIQTALKEIKQFKPRKASEFSEIFDYKSLLEAQNTEEEALNKEYLYYSERFDKINLEMEKRK